MDSARPPDRSSSSLGLKDDRKEVGDGDMQQKGDREQISKSSKGVSWVEVAQDKKVLKKFEVEVLSKDGVHSVEIPDEILDNSTPLWDDFIVGKFLDLAPHVAKVHMVVNKIWRYGDPDTKVDVYEVNPTTMRFKVSNQRAREKILRRGMWNIAGVPMVVSKWKPKTEDEKQEEEAIPMWVHLGKVPLHMYSWEGLSFFTSTVGVPVKLHPETIACTNMEEAKVFVNVDVSKVLPKEITFTKGGKQFTIAYYYPWLPGRCKICEKWGHGESVCTKNGKGKQSKDESRSSGQVRSVEASPSRLNFEIVKDDGNDVENKENSKEQEVNVEAVIDGDLVKEVEEGSNTSKWSLVSPAKVGRFVVDLAQEEIEVQISASKFSVLMEDKEDGEILGDDIEFNKEMEELECELMEDDGLEQQVNEEARVEKRRGRKPKALDANPKSTRTSRRKH